MPNKNKILKDLLITNEGKYNSHGFVFFVRGKRIEICEKKIPITEESILHKILMGRFIGSYLYDFPVSSTIIAPEKVINILCFQYTDFKNHRLLNEPFTCGQLALSCIALYSILNMHKYDIKSLTNLTALIDSLINTLKNIPKKNNNHYLRGLYSLLLCCDYGWLTDRDKYVNLTIDIFKTMFTSDGFFKENSSEYHLYACKLLQLFISTGHFASTILEDLYTKAESFSKNLFCNKHIGFLFGDSQQTSLKSYALRYYAPKKDGVNIYPEAGIAFSSLADGTDYLCFINCHHNNGAHGHNDFLSFEWFIDNKSIIIDPSFYKIYDIKNADTFYFRTSSAHNTIDTDKLGHDSSNSKKTILGYRMTSDLSKLEGEIIDKNFTFKRVITHRSSHLSINDELASNNVKVFYSQLMLSPIFKFLYSTKHCLFFIDTEYNLIKIESSLRKQIYYGSKEPIFGWYAETYDTRKPTNQIIFEGECTPDRNKYEISIYYIRKSHFKNFLILPMGSFSVDGFTFLIRGESIILNSDSKSIQHIRTLEANKIVNILMMRFASTYLLALPEAADILRINTAITIFKSLFTEFKNDRLFTDPMVCGQAILFYICLLEILKNEKDCNIYDIKTMLCELITILNNKKLYNNNHSLRGLYALFIASVYGYNTIDAESYAKSIGNMYSQLLTDDGFYRENSSEYQIYALDHLLPIFREHELISKYTGGLTQKTSHFTSFLFIDKEHAFNFGDSDPHLLASYAAKYYQKRKDGTVVFPSSGIVFSQLNNAKDHICFINFYYNNGVHNHSDYCSFEWFADGQWIIIDPAKYLYKNDFKGCWFRSSQAHNTIDVDVLDHDPKTSLKSITGLYDQNIAKLTGKIQDKNFIFQRSIVHSVHHITIVDWLTATRQLSSINSQLMLSPNFKLITQDNGTLYFKDSRENSLKITTTIETTVYNGSESPFYGWCAPKYASITPTTQIVFSPSILNDHTEYEIDIEYIKQE